MLRQSKGWRSECPYIERLTGQILRRAESVKAHPLSGRAESVHLGADRELRSKGLIRNKGLNRKIKGDPFFLFLLKLCVRLSKRRTT